MFPVSSLIETGPVSECPHTLTCVVLAVATTHLCVCSDPCPPRSWRLALAVLISTLPTRGGLLARAAA